MSFSETVTFPGGSALSRVTATDGSGGGPPQLQIVLVASSRTNHLLSLLGGRIAPLPTSQLTGASRTEPLRGAR